MVFFCPDCQYTLGISKSSTLEDYDDERKEISNVNEVFKLIEKDVDFSDYKTNILKTDLVKNKKYTKLNNSQKNNINQLFSSKIYDADLNCTNCGYRKQISSTIKLYEFNVSDKENIVEQLMITNFYVPILLYQELKILHARMSNVCPIRIQN